MPQIQVESFTEELTKVIKDVDEAMKALADSPVKGETIVILIQASLGGKIGKGIIRDVLFALNDLKTQYLKEGK